MNFLQISNTLILIVIFVIANNLSDFIIVIAVDLFILAGEWVIRVCFDLPNTLAEIIYVI